MLLSVSSYKLASFKLALPLGFVWGMSNLKLETINLKLLTWSGPEKLDKKGVEIKLHERNKICFQGLDFHRQP